MTRFILASLALTLMSVLASASHHGNHHWTASGDISPDHVHRVIFGLKNRNVNKLHDIVSQVSNPLDASYGKYMTLEEIRDLTAPTSDAAKSVSNWWMAAGAQQVDITASGDWVIVSIPVRHLERALGVPMRMYSHPHSSRRVLRASSRVALPAAVSEHVDVVLGLFDFLDHPRERVPLKKALGTCPPVGTPEVASVRGSESYVNVTVWLYCKDGSVPTDVNNPCATAPPRIATFHIWLQPPQGDAMMHDGKLATGVRGLPCTAGNGHFACVVPVTIGLPPYSRLNISVETIYDDGTESQKGYYPTLHALTAEVVPSTIYDLYGVPPGTRGTHPKNLQSVLAFEEQYISMDDLKSFFQLANMSYQEPSVWGQNDPTNPGGESTLDIQYIMGVGAGIPSIFWSVTGPGPAKPPGQGAYILEWAVQVANTTTVPLVTSISYGDTEDGYYKKYGDFSYINRMDVELAKMALRGMTVFAGSGDAGVSNVGEEGNDISDTDPSCTPFRPFYPSNSKYVTSVSSTLLTKNTFPDCVGQNPKPAHCDQVGEVSVSVTAGAHWTTGGGFSNMSSNPTPPWQKEAVSNYLSGGVLLPPNPGNFWNPSGRGYPDMSTVGHNLLVVLGGQVVHISGTSASGPVLAGLFSLINDARLNQGMPPLGLLNPFLYLAQTQGGANDVLVGKNYDGDIQHGCSQYATYCPYGFLNSAGWNPVTGLGTPRWDRLLELSLNPSLLDNSK